MSTNNKKNNKPVILIKIYNINNMPEQKIQGRNNKTKDGPNRSLIK